MATMTVKAPLTIKTEAQDKALAQKEAQEMLNYLNEFTSKVPAKKITALFVKIRKNPEAMLDKAMPFL